eukprot:1500105-Lingulodinium_polyedra.AAC.1
MQPKRDTVAVEVVALRAVELERFQVERVPVRCCSRDPSPLFHVGQAEPQCWPHSCHPEARLTNLP